MKYVLNHDIEFENSLNLLLITVVKIRYFFYLPDPVLFSQEPDLTCM